MKISEDCENIVTSDIQNLTDHYNILNIAIRESHKYFGFSMLICSIYKYMHIYLPILQSIVCNTIMSTNIHTWIEYFITKNLDCHQTTQILIIKTAMSVKGFKVKWKQNDICLQKDHLQSLIASEQCERYTPLMISVENMKCYF